MKIKPPSMVIAEALKNAERKAWYLSGEEKLALEKDTEVNYELKPMLGVTINQKYIKLGRGSAFPYEDNQRF